MTVGRSSKLVPRSDCFSVNVDACSAVSLSRLWVVERCFGSTGFEFVSFVSEPCFGAEEYESLIRVNG